MSSERHRKSPNNESAEVRIDDSRSTLFASGRHSSEYLGGGGRSAAAKTSAMGGLTGRQSGPTSPISRSSAAPGPRRPRTFALSKQASNEDLINVLRSSLAASTPSPLNSYREGPPSSNASSCDSAYEHDIHSTLDDDDAPEVSPTEWEAWIDWDKLGDRPMRAGIASMRIG